MAASTDAQWRKEKKGKGKKDERKRWNGRGKIVNGNSGEGRG